jgi:hypothetical protein
MSNKPIRPFVEEEAPTSKLRLLCSTTYMIPLGILFLLCAIGLAIFLLPIGSFITNPNGQDIANLKTQAATLNQRMDQLEAAQKTSTSPSIDSENLKEFETRLTAIQQKIETLQNQPQAEIPAIQVERSKTLEKDLSRVADSQKILKSVILFWRLRTTVLSDAPYRTELTDFKTVSKESDELSYLEKYADHGLQALKESQNISEQPPMGESATSWWDRVKTMAGSFIKIEKIDTPVSPTPPSLQDRQAVVDVLEQIEQTLMQQLMTTSLSSTPLPGDAL